MRNGANPKSKKGTENAGWVENQPVFHVDHENDAKIYRQNDSRDVSDGRRMYPNVNAYRRSKYLNEPGSWGSAVTIWAGTKKEVITPFDVCRTSLTGRAAKTPRDRQNI